MNFENTGEQFLQHIVDYVLELRGQGHFLPYQDYEVIAGWTREAASEDDLILVLSEVLPGFFEVSVGSRPKSLVSVNKKVLKALKTRAMMR